LFKEKTVILLCGLYIYLIFNSLISIDFESSFKRNFGFIRYILLFIAINYFFLRFSNFNKIFKFWLIIFLIILSDVIYEYYFGYNFIGFTSNNSRRIVSFFKNEEVIGTFLNGFFFILIGFLLTNLQKKNKIEKLFIFSFLAISIICMIITGERSNTFKLFIGLIILFFLNDQLRLKYKITLAISIIGVVIIFSNLFISSQQKNSLKDRFINQTIERLNNPEKRKNYIYFQLYDSGFKMFKEYPFFGVGNKNYRFKSCDWKENLTAPADKKYLQKYLCNTHPHQIYIEFLSEHGFLGTLILLSILFYLIFKNYRNMLIKKNILQISCFSYLMTFFVPVLPSGSFFADFNANFFWITFSIYYASNSETNIFKK
tara:strand:+ start:5451 stop:6566 length:1116 start_codon:yes stop_codon:yes gene_type:complete